MDDFVQIHPDVWVRPSVVRSVSVTNDDDGHVVVVTTPERSWRWRFPEVDEARIFALRIMLALLR